MEKTARRINLDSEFTIITSQENDTGKSCVIKSIYHALGASPANFHNEWEKIQPITILKFEKDGDLFSILRKERIIAIFDSKMSLIKSFKSIGKELSVFYEDFFDFRLKLVGSTDLETKTPFPSHYFLPFYIDQDAGWKANWSSFDDLRAFKEWKKDLVDYHTGIRPNKYYESKAKKAKSIQEKQEKQNEANVINRVYMKTIEKSKLTHLDMDVNIADFKKEISELMRMMTTLSEIETKYKTHLMELYNDRAIILHQIGIATKTKKDLKKDFEFSETLPEEVVCPTCGTVHLNTFTQRYLIAQDEGRCYQLILDLKVSLNDIEKKIEKAKLNFDENSEKKTDIENILNRKKENVRLKDYIDSVGQKSFNVNLKKELHIVEDEVAILENELKDIDKEMRGFDNPKHKEGIIDYYVEFMRTFLHELDVQKLSEDNYKKISSNIKENGSDLSRALLAYYYSILRVMQLFSSTYDCPIVIDSPLQDEQDAINKIKILKFIKEQKPSGSQLILGCVGMDELIITDTYTKINGVTFDQANTINLDVKFQALKKEDYNILFDEFKEYIDILLSSDLVT